MKEQDMDELVKLFNRKLITTPTAFHRYLYDRIEWRDSLIGIKGPKGCGKTTLILQHIKERFQGEALEKVLYEHLSVSRSGTAGVLAPPYTIHHQCDA